MSSFDWQVVSQISLGIGLVLLLAALVIAVRFRVISNLVSELTSKGGRAEPASQSPSVSRSLRASENMAFDDQSDDNKDGDIITVVVGHKKKENISDTVVVGTKTDSGSDFRIVRNVLLINADVEAIDDHGRDR
ncbi:hypothetical protein [Ruminococcus sp.]|jgi:ABC-type sulfate transport system substrate-binding protein|uniref:hypothetical protein n=1 Tax=Ruminococcus sp. TaxID=41978 RepID=UPI002BCDBF50|nr:hypothetical protein [Ruminococcus sp.]HOA00409.1 hypothetical protein [Ruminococcus sp.]HOH87574.1 hypothetical protein [Ruminococcus sp.]